MWLFHPAPQPLLPVVVVLPRALRVATRRGLDHGRDELCEALLVACSRQERRGRGELRSPGVARKAGEVSVLGHDGEVGARVARRVVVGRVVVGRAGRGGSVSDRSVSGTSASSCMATVVPAGPEPALAAAGLSYNPGLPKAESADLGCRAVRRRLGGAMGLSSGGCEVGRGGMHKAGRCRLSSSGLL